MQLQSKVYEPTTTYTLVLFLNAVSQLDAWYGIHPGLQELSICAAASVADWAINHGYAIGLYTNTIMFMPEEGMPLAKETDEKEDEENEGTGEPERLEATIAAQVKRRRIHLPPASSEEQRKRIMEVLARVQPYFGTAIEDVIQAERTRLPAGATVVVVTSTISDLLLDTLARVKQSGHAVTLLFIGNSPLPAKLAGITVYHLGGDDTWQELEKGETQSLTL